MRLGRWLARLASPRRARVRALVRQADAANAARDWPAAEAAYARALDAEPGRMPLWVQLGHARKEQGDRAGAEAAYRRALALDAGVADTHLQLGHLLKLDRRPDEARAAYVRAAALQPDLPGLRQELEALGAPVPAAPAPGALPPPTDAAGWLARADAANAARDWPAARTAYAAALEAEPGRAAVWVQYGHALKELGDDVPAEAAYRRALFLAPEAGDTHLQLAHLLKRTGRRDAAIAAYEAAAARPDAEAAARRELAALGVEPHVEGAFRDRLAGGGLGAAAILAHEVAQLRLRLDALAARLPAVRAETAWPAALYGAMRGLHGLPAPPEGDAAPAVAVLLPLDGVPCGTVWRQLHALFEQASPAAAVLAFGAPGEGLRAVARMEPACPSLRGVSAEPGERPAVLLRRVLAAASADWILVLGAGGVPDRLGLAWCALAAARAGQAEAVIFDEDWEESAEDAEEPAVVGAALRQAVDHDWLLDGGSQGQGVLVRRTALLAALDRYPTAETLEVLRTGLLLDLARAGTVGHLPLPLFRRPQPEARAAEHGAAVRLHAAAAGFLDAITGLDGSRLPLALTWTPPEPAERLTVIVATRDNAEDLAGLVESLRILADAPEALAFRVVDNGSREPYALARLAELAAAPDVSVLTVDEPFNWSRLNNLAAEGAEDGILVFANDDMAMLTPGWDRHLRGLLARPEVGAAGGLLLYPDGSVQHAGVLFGWQGSTIHDGLHAPGDAAGPDGRWAVTRTAGAVTGAFLAMRRDLFRDLRGFDEILLPVAHSDIDLCLRIRRAGRRVLWTPRIALTHHESKSRGLDHLDPERRARESAERAAMRRRWGALLAVEAGMNPAWTRAILPFRLIEPAGVDAVLDHLALTCSPRPWWPERA